MVKIYHIINQDNIYQEMIDAYYVRKFIKHAYIAERTKIDIRVEANLCRFF